MKNKAFLTEIQALRNRARQHIDEGAVTAGYGADSKTVLKLLNDALATEIVCILRYRRHHFMAKGIQAKSIAEESLGANRGRAWCRLRRDYTSVGTAAGIQRVCFGSLSSRSTRWS